MLVLALGCAPTESAPTPEPRWRVPDGECGDVHEDATAESGRTAMGLSPALERIAELSIGDRFGVGPGGSYGSRPPSKEQREAAHARREEIDRLIAENHDAIVGLASTNDAAIPDGLAALFERTAACGRNGLDPTPLFALMTMPEQAGVLALRRISRWPAWELQAFALFGLEAAQDPELSRVRDEVTTNHWSAELRERGSWFGPSPGHGAAGCTAGLPETIVVTRGEESIEIPRFDHGEAPRHRLPPAYTRIEGHTVDLRDDADIMLEIDDGWLVGVNDGEFGGGLFVVSATGDVRTLDAGQVLDIQRTDLGIVVLTGLAHLRMSAGRILGITRDASGRVIRRHRFGLPARPEGMRALPGGTLLVATDVGIIELAPDDTTSLLPCTEAPE